MLPHLLFLGTSDSKGVPRLGCPCAICQAALPNSPNFRTRAALLLVSPEGTILIDTPPETRLRFAELNLSLPDALFMTHPHDDHILGFADVVKAILDHDHVCPIYAPVEVFTGLRGRFEYLWTSRYYQAAMDLRSLTGAITLFGWTLEAVRVHHGYNGWSYGYLIEREGWRGGYFSDAIMVEPAVQARWRGLDTLILGSNFWHETAPMARRSVYDTQEALKVAQEAQVGGLILTHLSHKIDITVMEALLPDWASFAKDSQKVATR